MVSPVRFCRPRAQSGAFDLPSVLIGVAVVAILAIGVMATIFGVIPWAQDRAAQQDLAAVSTAQGTTYAHAGSFTGKAALVGAGWLGEGTPAALDTKAGAEGECYVAVTTSKTGNRFVVSNERPTPRPLADEDAWCSGVLITPDPAPVMISTWDTGIASNCKEISLPVEGFKGTVAWGDDTSDAKLTHSFAAAREVSIRIDGTFSAWGGEAWADANCLLSVDRWGSTGTTSLKYAFDNADNLVHVEAIPSATAKDLSRAFSSVDSKFSLGKLDTSGVTNMSSMFIDAKAFNHPVDFDTSRVSAFSAMFNGASAFNQPVNFDTSKAKILSYVFYNATAFNQPVNFDTSSATSMGYMFYGASKFNQPLKFDTARVTTMERMFGYAAAFNQPLSFDTSKVTLMRYMFYGAETFNQDLSQWDVQVVTDHSNFGGTDAWTLPMPNWVN